MEQTTSTSSRDAAHGLLDKVRTGATAQLSTSKERATDGLGSLAQAVRQSTQPFRDNQQDTVAQYIEKAADQLDRFSTSLRERDINEIVDDVQRFARRQPALFIGAAFAAGMLAARFLKSSSNDRDYPAMPQYGQRQTRYGTPSSTTGPAFGTPSSAPAPAITSTPQYGGGGL